MGPVGIYVHFAFCRRKCHYCDFNSRVGSPEDKAVYIDALLAEIGRLPALVAQTVYFGGGTPTIHSPADLKRVLDALTARLSLCDDAEVTVEANPGTVDKQGLQMLREAGFNRLSLGVQSLRDGELRMLGRIHDSRQAVEAFQMARQGGFDNVSVDLIRGLPGQKLQHWQHSVQGVIDLAPEHVSAYGLSVEQGTPLQDRIDRGLLPCPGGDDDPEWIRWTVLRLQQAGLQRYEISNYARPGRESVHNTNYWQDGEYVGVGAGAWSFLDGERRRNVADPALYSKRSIEGGRLTTEAERLDADEAVGEAIMLGLRMVRGISYDTLRRRFGVDVRRRYRETIRKLIAAELVVDDHRQLRLTFEGMLVQNAVAVHFLA